MTSVDSSQPSVSRVKRANGRNCPLLPCTWTWPCTWTEPNLRHLFLPLSLLQVPSCSSFPSSKLQHWLHLPPLCVPLHLIQEVCKYLILKTALFLCFCFVKGYFYSLHLQHIIHSSSFCLEVKGYLYLNFDIAVSFILHTQVSVSSESAKSLFND